LEDGESRTDEAGAATSPSGKPAGAIPVIFIVFKFSVSASGIHINWNNDSFLAPPYDDTGIHLSCTHGEGRSYGLGGAQDRIKAAVPQLHEGQRSIEDLLRIIETLQLK